MMVVVPLIRNQRTSIPTLRAIPPRRVYFLYFLHRRRHGYRQEVTYSEIMEGFDELTTPPATTRALLVRALLVLSQSAVVGLPPSGSWEAGLHGHAWDCLK